MEEVLTEFVVFAAASAVAFFSFAVAAVAAAKVRAVAFAGSPFLLVVVVVVVVVVVGWKAVVHLFEEFDLLAGIQTWFQQVRLMDSTFVVLRRTMLHYYSFQFK